MRQADDAAAPPQRKGARTRDTIPAEVLRALNEGREATITLVEYLAVDHAELLRHVLKHARADARATERILDAARATSGIGVMARMSAIARALHEHLGDQKRLVLGRLGTHPSDIAREWAALAIVLEEGLTLEQRLDLLRPFAADEHMAVREMAWVAFRPYLADELGPGLELLAEWARDADPYIRRFASEVSRPRGVWTKHLTELKDHPERGLLVIEPLRSDESRYVQASVGNWLNDASKSRPDWVEDVCARWSRESTTKETQWIVRRALRSIRRSSREPD